MPITIHRTPIAVNVQGTDELNADAKATLDHAISVFGFLVSFHSPTTLNEFISLIRGYSCNAKSRALASELATIDAQQQRSLLH